MGNGNFIEQAVAEGVAAEQKQIMEDTQAVLAGLGLEVINQQSPEHGLAVYRGIRLGQFFLIDHHPEWGELT